MSKYSSILFGADNYEEIGPFRFPVWGELVPGEIRSFEKIAKRQSRSTFKSLHLASKIAAERGITEDEAIELMSTLTLEENKDLLYKYAEDLDDIQETSMSDWELKISYVTAFMQYRGEVKMPGREQYQQTKDWTTEDTEKTPKTLIQQIYDFCMKERDGKQEGEAKKEPARARRA